MTTVGILHPGAMGAAIAQELVSAGHAVFWASERRSKATAGRAEAAGAVNLVTVQAVAEASTVMLSICPPGAALDMARALPRFDGIFVDANAIAPSTAADVAGVVRSAGATFVDGSVVGPPPSEERRTRLYLCGASATQIAALFAGTAVQTVQLAGAETSASALKMAYAAWTKGSMALGLASLALARAHGIESDLLAEWGRSQPGQAARSKGAAAEALAKGWRWVSEMEEVTAAMAAADLPVGFHDAARAIYARTSHAGDPAAGDELEQVLRLLLAAKV